MYLHSIDYRVIDLLYMKVTPKSTHLRGIPRTSDQIPLAPESSGKLRHERRVSVGHDSAHGALAGWHVKIRCAAAPVLRMFEQRFLGCSNTDRYE